MMPSVIPSATTVGYMVGRFNPLQKGHLAILEHVHQNNDQMVVLVGSAAEGRTHKNPLTFDERKQLILQSFPRALVLPLPDMPGDEDWVRLFESTISMGIDSLRLEGAVTARLYSADATRADDYALRCAWVANLGHEVVPFRPVMARTDLSASLVRDCWYNGRYEEVRELVPEATLALLQRLDIGWMDSHYVKRVPTGCLAAKNAVFVAFVSEPEHLYRVDPACRAWGQEAWNARLAMLGHVVRWNGELGFVGGLVDEGETLEEAVLRECVEEVGYLVDPARLVPVCSHSMVGRQADTAKHTHLYLCRVSADELFQIRRQALDAPHARTEMSGFAVTHMTPDAPGVLLRQQWAGTACEQLKVLLSSGLVPAAQLVEDAA
jgi:cytidyltransferase-like protein